MTLQNEFPPTVLSSPALPRNTQKHPAPHQLNDFSLRWSHSVFSGKEQRTLFPLFQANLKGVLANSKVKTIELELKFYVEGIFVFWSQFKGENDETKVWR